MLQWLIDQVYAILNLIGTIYKLISSWASNLLGQIITWANWAKNEAIAHVLYYYNLARNSIAAYADYLWNWLFKIRDEIVGWAYNEFNKLYTTLNNVGTWLLQNINSALSPITNWMIQQIAGLQNFISNLQNNILGVINWWRDKLSQLEHLVNNIRIPTIDDIVKLVMRDIWPIVSKLVEIAKDPIGYIVAVVAKNIIPLLSCALAWGLGTVKHELPPAPNYYQKNNSQ